MDVNVKDIVEIIRFRNALRGFLSDYIESLGLVFNRAMNEKSNVGNILRTIRNQVDSLKRNLESAERMLEEAIERVSESENDLSGDIDFAESIVEERRMLYEEAKNALDEAEGIERKVNSTIDNLVYEINRGKSQIIDVGNTTLDVITKAAERIASYVK